MTHPEALSRIAELQKQLDELKASLEKKNTDGLWKPEDGEIYYTVDHTVGVISYDFNRNNTGDKERIRSENYFQTPEQAERHAKRLRLSNKLWRLAEHLNGFSWRLNPQDRETDRWILQYCPTTDTIQTCKFNLKSFGLPVFKYEELAEKAISTLTDEEKEIFKNIYRP